MSLCSSFYKTSLVLQNNELDKIFVEKGLYRTEYCETLLRSWKDALASDYRARAGTDDISVFMGKFFFHCLYYRVDWKNSLEESEKESNRIIRGTLRIRTLTENYLPEVFRLVQSDSDLVRTFNSDILQLSWDEVRKCHLFRKHVAEAESELGCRNTNRQHTRFMHFQDVAHLIHACPPTAWGARAAAFLIVAYETKAPPSSW